MKRKLLKQLGGVAILVLSMLIFSQGLWLWKQLEQEKQAFTLKVENSLQSMINFHALQGYSTTDPTKPGVATISMEETTNEGTNKDTSPALGKSEINTKNYIPNFALGKLIEASFIDISLAKERFHLTVVDSLFISNFPN